MSDMVEADPAVLGPVDAYGPRPQWRGRLHQYALSRCRRGSAAAQRPLVSAQVAVAIYWASLAGLFGASASYHLLARSERAVKWLRRLDHSMIFMLIAGTYTPICLVVLPRAWGIPTLVAIWVTALAGVIMKMIRVGTQGGKSGSWLYGVLGWSALVTMPKLLTTLDVPQMVLLAAGGALYTGGAIILGKRRPNPSPTIFGYHEVWHALTILAGGSHFAMVFLVVR